MRKIKAQKLTREGFAEFGAYFDFRNPSGYSLKGETFEFFRDPLSIHANGSAPFRFSGLQVKKNPDLTFKGMEYHDHTGEVQMPVDDDTVLVVAPANGGDIVPEEVRAFIVPQGVMVILKQATWHDAMVPVSRDRVNILIGLPERVYHNDLVAKPLPEPGAVEM